MNDQSFLGRGWGFPPTFNKQKKRVEMVANVTDINQSLAILLDTSLGERVMQPDYGCNLKEFLFEPQNSTLTTYMEDVVRTAIVYHEPRIKVNHINIETDRQVEGRLLIDVAYTIRSTNTRSNYVYPFYIQEASDLN